MADVVTSLLPHRAAFRAFVISRVGNEADADDILQHGLIKALQRGPTLRDHERAVAWFYRLLRRAIIDHLRSRAAARLRDDAWSSDALPLAVDDDAERQICRCFEALLPSLKPRHAALLRAVELDAQSVSAAAATLGLTAAHASVLLHRGRAELRARLEAFCGECARGACLDCDCPPPAR